jgi:hypothetical protein
MVIMKMLYNNKGISLVVLIVAMTLIALLGASFVSLMGSKQKGFLYQIDSYRALNLANAGVEYAIRYAGDNINPNQNVNDFFHNPAAYPNVPVVSSQPDVTNLATAQWKRFDFGNGQFYISYYFDPLDPDNFNSNKILYSVGVMKETKRVVKLKKFLTYAAPASSVGLDKLNLVPNQRPYISGPSWGNYNYVVVPILNLTTSDITISSMQFEAHLDNSQTKEFKDIYRRETNGYGGTKIYTYTAYPDNCPAPLPCKGVGPPNCVLGSPCIEIPHGGPKTKELYMTISTIIPSQAIRWFSFQFGESGGDLSGTYTVTFNFSGGPSIIQFYLPDS